MMPTRPQIRFHRPGVLLLGTLLLFIGALGTGCSSSGAARQGSSGGAPTAEVDTTAQDTTKQDEASADAKTASTDAAPTGEPVKVLRLPEVREQLDEAAQDWYGTPYDWGGNSKQGVDCSGFVKNVYDEAFGYNLPRVTETQLQAGPKVARDQIRPGDLVFFRPNNEYNHVGVYLGQETFAHASSSNGVTKSSIEKNYWDKYYWTARRPLTTSVIPDTLTTELLAYKYPEADSTVRVADVPESERDPSREQTASSSAGTATKIASCAAPDVQCAASSTSSEESSDSADDNTTRKGW